MRSLVKIKSIPNWHLLISQMETKWTKWYAMTSHVIAYRSLELLFGTHTFHTPLEILDGQRMFILQLCGNMHPVLGHFLHIGKGSFHIVSEVLFVCKPRYANLSGKVSKYTFILNLCTSKLIIRIIVIPTNGDKDSKIGFISYILMPSSAPFSQSTEICF